MKNLGALRRILRAKFLAALFVLVAATPLFAESSVKPDVLFRVGGFPFTNSMLATAVFAVILIVLLRFVLLRGGAKLVPNTAQFVVESLIDSFEGMFSDVMGKRAYRGAAPFLLCVFTFILAMNWSGLLPAVGSVGTKQTAQVAQADVARYLDAGFQQSEVLENGKVLVEKFVPYIRAADSDLNTTLALALISTLLFLYFVKKYAGFRALYHEWFGNKANKNEIPIVVYYVLFPVFFAVGFIEVISACVRPISLSFRLFGNVFGGETLLDAMHAMAWQGGVMQIVSWILPLPFYFLELLVGIVQAFVFTLLSAIYIGLITNSGSEESQLE